MASLTTLFEEGFVKGITYNIDISIVLTHHPFKLSAAADGTHKTYRYRWSRLFGRP